MARTVVIVDDHPTFRRFARRLLEEAGFAVVGEADDGAEAIATVTELGPDVVLLDVILPDISGLEVARQLAVSCPASAVVLTSSRSADDFGLADRADGGPRFIGKDELVIARLEDVLGDRG